MRKTLLAAALAAMSSVAMADVAIFTVDPAAVGSAEAPFDANLINGTSSSSFQVTNPTTLTGQAWANFTSFALNSIDIPPGTTGLGVDYSLFAVVTATTTLTSGTIGQDGSTYDLTTFNYTIYADPGFGSVFTASNAGTMTQAGVVLDADVLTIGTGSLLTGVNGFNAGGGHFLNVLTNFALVDPDGPLFFIDPDPFYSLQFSQFNNTGQGVERNGEFIAINQSAGGIDFLQVPEPSGLALIGVGLVGLAGVGRRKFNWV